MLSPSLFAPRNCPLCRALLFVFVLSTYNVYGTQDTASNGSWGSADAWGSGAAPESGDTLEIPDGVNVIIDGNFGDFTDMQVNLRGTLTFNNGRKLRLAADGTVNIYSSGRLTGGNGGSALVMGGITVWDGNEPDMVGPQTCLTSGCFANLALPVELTHFSVKTERFGHLVTWETATEKNSDYFILQASETLLDWRDECTVSAAGHSQNTIQYECEPATPSTYYQLLQVDMDGSFEIFGPITAREGIHSASEEVSMLIQGNTLRLRAPEESTLNRVSIVNLSGHQFTTSCSGSNTCEIDLAGISGLVVVKVERAYVEDRIYKVMVP